MLQCPLKDHLEDSSVMDEGNAKETLISKKSIYDVSLDDEVCFIVKVKQNSHWIIFYVLFCSRKLIINGSSPVSSSL